MGLSVDAFRASNTTFSTGMRTGLHLSYNEDGNKQRSATFEVLC